MCVASHCDDTRKAGRTRGVLQMSVNRMVEIVRVLVRVVAGS